ncbi:MAG: hypothetical protein HW421_3762 [Ignavibacteria bacterium]|nr:hypothetical protein [Ignavibacteria bacterium]
MRRIYLAAKLVFMVLLVFIRISTETFCQKFADQPYTTRSSYGIFADVDFNFHTANFRNLPFAESCCPGFEIGTGFGYEFGLFYLIPFTDQLELNLRGGYFNLSGVLSKTEPTTVFDLSTKRSVNGEFEHSVDGTLNSAGLMPLLSYRLSDQMRLHGGFRAAYLLTKSIKLKEEISTPNWGTFDNGFRVRNQKEGDIDGTIDAALVAGISYDLPLNSTYTLFLVPEAFFSFGLTSMGTGLAWTVNTLNAGIAIKYAPRKIIPPKPPPPPPVAPPLPPPPPPPAPPALDATILAVGLEKDGKEKDVSTMRIEEFQATRMHPLLNYIFFDENSAEIHVRYKRITEKEKEDFSVNKLYNLKTMEVYYQLLNIVGRRLQAYPQSNVTLTGTNSDEGLEKGNMALSKSRADAMKDYLVNVWNIPESRITVKSKNLPDLPSNITNDDGKAENRRVEISSNFPQVLEPMIIGDTVREANPPNIRFKSKINTPIGVKQWKVITMQTDKNLRIFSGTGTPPDKIDWDLGREEEQTYIPRFTEPLKYKLWILDNDNKEWESAVQVLPVEQVTIEHKQFEMIGDKRIDKFSLIQFGFNKSDLSKDHIFIADKAKKIVQKNSIIQIIGHTDRIGDELLNLDLSKKRANSTAKYLMVPFETATGVGEEKPLYLNDTPEGRFYNRTVTLEIVTPIE